MCGRALTPSTEWGATAARGASRLTSPGEGVGGHFPSELPELGQRFPERLCPLSPPPPAGAERTLIWQSPQGSLAGVPLF